MILSICGMEFYPIFECKIKKRQVNKVYGNNMNNVSVKNNECIIFDSEQTIIVHDKGTFG